MKPTPKEIEKREPQHQPVEPEMDKAPGKSLPEPNPSGVPDDLADDVP